MTDDNKQKSKEKDKELKSRDNEMRQFTLRKENEPEPRKDSIIHKEFKKTDKKEK